MSDGKKPQPKDIPREKAQGDQKSGKTHEIVEEAMKKGKDGKK